MEEPITLLNDLERLNSEMEIFFPIYGERWFVCVPY